MKRSGRSFGVNSANVTVPYAFMTPNAVGASEYLQIWRVALGWESRFLTSLWSDASSRLTSPLALLHFNVTQQRVVDRA